MIMAGRGLGHFISNSVVDYTIDASLPLFTKLIAIPLVSLSEAGRGNKAFLMYPTVTTWPLAGSVDQSCTS